VRVVVEVRVPCLWVTLAGEKLQDALPEQANVTGVFNDSEALPIVMVRPTSTVLFR